MRTLAWLALPALAALAVGCSSPEISPARLQTDSNEYLAVLQRSDGPFRTLGFRVVAQFTNQGDTPLFLARCYPVSPGPMFTVELLEAVDAWGAAYDPVWACVGHDEQFLVQPGETRTDTLLLAGPNVYHGITRQSRVALSGRMRLRYSVQRCTGDGACLLREGIPSNVFLVGVGP